MNDRTKDSPLEALRYHVTGAIERGEAQAITEKRGLSPEVAGSTESELPDEVRKYMKKIGEKGGRASKRELSSEQARAMGAKGGRPKVVKELHIPAVMKQNNQSAVFHTKSWSYRFECPACGKSQRFNTNYLGRKEVICNGSTVEKRELCYGQK